MNTPNSNITLSLLLIVLATISSSFQAHSQGHHNFLQCLSSHTKNSPIVYTPENPSYPSILNISTTNPRFATPSTPKPAFIVTPEHESQIPPIILCAKKNNLQIRTRSGGHDYEGLSYTSQVPFIVVDLFKITKIALNVAQKTAWVQAGATIGQLYYKISQASRTLAFPSGSCPTVGVSGHFSGGGYGLLLRKYGVSADNIVDARIVDVNGRILNRKSMGEDLFWAIRGGGGASFGVVTAWKLNLVPVPETVTIFSVDRTLGENATEIIYKWQYVAPNLPKELYISPSFRPGNSSKIGGKTVLATFSALFLGGRDELLGILHEKFPELGVNREDCNEVSWIQSAVFFAEYDIGSSPEVLASRIPISRHYYKAKSDYIKEPIPYSGFEGIWKLLYEKEADDAKLILSPYGGRMSEISESAIPFPHRAGYLYKIQHIVNWDEPGRDVSERYISWIRRLYRYMSPYVSKFPRAAYVNYRDLDLGVNNEGNTSYAQASIWGLKYFGGNFERLVRVKSAVDPSNFFRNEQSIPSINFHEKL